MRFRKHTHTERARVFQAPAAVCDACPLTDPSPERVQGRQVKRNFNEVYLERVRGDHATEAHTNAGRTRQVWVEPLFAKAKAWHGLRRPRLRDVLNANIQGLLIAAGQNVKRVLSATGWGRRHAPRGSLVALPMEPWRWSVVSGHH